MRNPLTADERERRFVRYVLTLNKGEIGELRLSRLNRIANFRKQLRELIESMIEERAEDLAAAMWLEHAPERPEPLWKKEETAAQEKTFALPRTERKRSRMPTWIGEERKVAGNSAAIRTIRTAK
jgi:hypothetical protein